MKNKKILNLFIILLIAIIYYSVYFFLEQRLFENTKFKPERFVQDRQTHRYWHEKFARQKIIMWDDFEDLWQRRKWQGEVNLDDKIFKSGRRSLRVTLPESGEEVSVGRNVFFADWSKKSWRIFVRSNSWQNIEEASLLVSTRGNFLEYYSLNLAEHNVFLNEENEDWIEYTLDRSDFIDRRGFADWKTVNKVAINVASKKGETAEIWIDGWSENEQSSEAVLTLTFDDGWEDVYNVARPLMNEYGFQGTAYIIIPNIDLKQYLHEEQLEALNQDGWDISGHAMDSLLGQSLPALEKNIAETAEYLQRHGFTGAEQYAYPYGKYNDRVIDVLAKYFSSGRKINGLMQNPSYISPWQINSYQISKHYNQSNLYEIIDKAIKNNTWCIFTFHHIVVEPEEFVDFSVADFSDLLDYISASGISVRTMSEQLGRRS